MRPKLMVREKRTTEPGADGRKLSTNGLQYEGARMTRCLVAGIAATVTLLSLPACSSHSYMGIPLATGQIDPELQQLANRARAGDKYTQLELGIRFEEGRGVERDIAKARDMYRLAASDSGGPMWVYVPSAGNGTKGRVMQVNGGPKISGLAEARARLDSLTGIPGKN